MFLQRKKLETAEALPILAAFIKFDSLLRNTDNIPIDLFHQDNKKIKERFIRVLPFSNGSSHKIIVQKIIKNAAH
jgi:hypothetical protein